MRIYIFPPLYMEHKVITPHNNKPGNVVLLLLTMQCDIYSYYCYKSPGKNCSCCTLRSGPFRGTCHHCLRPVKLVKDYRRTIQSSTMKSKRYRKSWQDSGSCLRTAASAAVWRQSFYSRPVSSDLGMYIILKTMEPRLSVADEMTILRNTNVTRQLFIP